MPVSAKKITRTRMRNVLPYDCDVEILGRRPDGLWLDKADFWLGFLGSCVLNGHHEILYLWLGFLGLHIGVHHRRHKSADFRFLLLWRWLYVGHWGSVCYFANFDFWLFWLRICNVRYRRNISAEAHGLFPWLLRSRRFHRFLWSREGWDSSNRRDTGAETCGLFWQKKKKNNTDFNSRHIIPQGLDQSKGA